MTKVLMLVIWLLIWFYSWLIYVWMNHDKIIQNQDTLSTQISNLQDDFNNGLTITITD